MFSTVFKDQNTGPCYEINSYVSGSDVGGASITLTGTGEGTKHLTTDQFGSYSTSTYLKPGTHTIEVHYAGDSDHEPSSATRTIAATP